MRSRRLLHAQESDQLYTAILSTFLQLDTRIKASRTLTLAARPLVLLCVRTCVEVRERETTNLTPLTPEWHPHTHRPTPLPFQSVLRKEYPLWFERVDRENAQAGQTSFDFSKVDHLLRADRGGQAGNDGRTLVSTLRELDDLVSVLLDRDRYGSHISALESTTEGVHLRQQLNRRRTAATRVRNRYASTSALVRSLFHDAERNIGTRAMNDPAGVVAPDPWAEQEARMAQRKQKAAGAGPGSGASVGASAGASAGAGASTGGEGPDGNGGGAKQGARKGVDEEGAQFVAHVRPSDLLKAAGYTGRLSREASRRQASRSAIREQQRRSRSSIASAGSSSAMPHTGGGVAPVVNTTAGADAVDALLGQGASPTAAAAGSASPGLATSPIHGVAPTPKPRRAVTFHSRPNSSPTPRGAAMAAARQRRSAGRRFLSATSGAAAAAASSQSLQARFGGSSGSGSGAGGFDGATRRRKRAGRRAHTASSAPSAQQAGLGETMPPGPDFTRTETLSSHNRKALYNMVCTRVGWLITVKALPHANARLCTGDEASGTTVQARDRHATLGPQAVARVTAGTLQACAPHSQAGGPATNSMTWRAGFEIVLVLLTELMWFKTNASATHQSRYFRQWYARHHRQCHETHQHRYHRHWWLLLLEHAQRQLCSWGTS